MSIKEARKICREFYNISIPTEDDKFLYIEALRFLIKETKDPQFMMELGGYYYEIKRYDLALKYYELAAEYDHTEAYECLGYIWYYGRTGERDYAKAFDYYSKAAERGDLVCQYKVADMYRNGYFVEKDQDKYEEIIESLYPQVKDARNLFDPLPEIFTRLARIRTKQGKTKEAIDLYQTAKDFLAERIRINPFFGNLDIMRGLIEDLYKLIIPDDKNYDFYDLYILLKQPACISFKYKSSSYELKAVKEDGDISVCFDGKWFHTVDDFFGKAAIANNLLTTVFDELYDFEIIKEDA